MFLTESSTITPEHATLDFSNSCSTCFYYYLGDDRQHREDGNPHISTCKHNPVGLAPYGLSRCDSSRFIVITRLTKSWMKAIAMYEENSEMMVILQSFIVLTTSLLTSLHCDFSGARIIVFLETGRSKLC